MRKFELNKDNYISLQDELYEEIWEKIDLIGRRMATFAIIVDATNSQFLHGHLHMKSLFDSFYISFGYMIPAELVPEIQEMTKILEINLREEVKGLYQSVAERQKVKSDSENANILMEYLLIYKVCTRKSLRAKFDLRIDTNLHQFTLNIPFKKQSIT